MTNNHNGEIPIMAIFFTMDEEIRQLGYRMNNNNRQELWHRPNRLIIILT